MKINKCILTKNDCYKAGKKITPVGIIVHSTGANNPELRRYVQPDDGIIGKNKYDNDWNRTGIAKCVHAFIGKDKNGKVRCYQTLPWDYRPYGCKSGKKGSYNNGYIQFEICEDALNDEKYFNEAFSLAIELCKYLMKKYPAIKVENVISHKEAYERGYASNHGDPGYWMKKFKKSMDWFRKQLLSTITFKTHRINGTWDGGSEGSQIDAMTMKVSEGDITYRAHRVDGVWGAEKTGYSTSDSSKRAGKIGIAIDAIAIKADGIIGTLKYRVHRVDGKWGNWITGYSTNDTTCYAGSFGKAIDSVEVKIE